MAAYVMPWVDTINTLEHNQVCYTEVKTSLLPEICKTQKKASVNCLVQRSIQGEGGETTGLEREEVFYIAFRARCEGVQRAAWTDQERRCSIFVD